MLQKHNVKATFCLVGVQVQEFPQLVRDIVADGHTLCNHTWKHDIKLGTRTEDAIRADLKKHPRRDPGRRARTPRSRTSATRAASGPRAAVEVAAEMGMASIGWDVDTSDWNIAKYPAGPAMTRPHPARSCAPTCGPARSSWPTTPAATAPARVAAFEIALPELVEDHATDG